MKKTRKFTLILAVVLLLSLILPSFSTVAKVEKDLYNRSIRMCLNEKVEYSETEDGISIFGFKAVFVAEFYNEFGGYWEYRILLPEEADVASAILAIKNSGAEFNENFPEPVTARDPRGYVYQKQDVIEKVKFSENIDFSAYGESFEWNGYTVLEVIGSGNEWSFKYESAEIANEAFDAFLLCENVVYINRGNSVYDVFGIGDINGDGRIDEYDYIALSQYISDKAGYGGNYDILRRNGDVNADFVVDQYDLILMKRHIMGTYNIDFITP